MKTDWHRPQPISKPPAALLAVAIFVVAGFGQPQLAISAIDNAANGNVVPVFGTAAGGRFVTLLGKSLAHGPDQTRLQQRPSMFGWDPISLEPTPRTSLRVGSNF